MPDPVQTAEGQQTPAQPQPGTPEYDKAMSDRYKAGQQGVDDTEAVPKTEVPAMPEGGADKFYNAETGAYNWQAHAKEAEYRASQSAKPDKTPGDDTSGAPGQESSTEPTPFSEAGLTQAGIEKELSETGKLSDDTKAGMKQLGIPDETVTWMESAHAAQKQAEAAAGEAAVAEAYDLAGGKESWETMEKWAVANLPREAVVELNERLDGPHWKNAISDLKARYEAAEGTGPRDLHSGSGRSSSPTGYTSRAEMKADMGKPEYKTDPAFRAQVMQKMQHATWSNDQY